jgi:hypothetical protein
VQIRGIPALQEAAPRNKGKAAAGISCRPSAAMAQQKTPQQSNPASACGQKDASPCQALRERTPGKVQFAKKQ